MASSQSSWERSFTGAAVPSASGGDNFWICWGSREHLWQPVNIYEILLNPWAVARQALKSVFVSTFSTVFHIFFVLTNALWSDFMWPWNTALKMVWDWGVSGLSHIVDGWWERDAALIANYHMFLSFWHEYPCRTTVQLAGAWTTPWKNMAVRDHHWLCWQRVHPLTAHLQDINKSRPQKVWCSNIFDLLKFLKHKKQVNFPVLLIRLCGNLAPAWMSHKPRASGMTSQRRDDLNGPCRALAEHGSFMEALQRIHEHSWTFMNILSHYILLYYIYFYCHQLSIARFGYRRVCIFPNCDPDFVGTHDAHKISQSKIILEMERWVANKYKVILRKPETCLPLFLADFTFLSVCGLLRARTYGNLSRQEISHRTQHEAPDPWKAPSSPYWPSNSGLACTAPTDLELRRARSREDVNCHSLENDGKHMKTFESWIGQEPISWENSAFLPSFTLRSARVWWPNTCINYSSWSSWETDEQLRIASNSIWV